MLVGAMLIFSALSGPKERVQWYWRLVSAAVGTWVLYVSFHWLAQSKWLAGH